MKSNLFKVIFWVIKFLRKNIFIHLLYVCMWKGC